MRSFQDKVCDALTLVCLLGVTAVGTASLLPKAKADTSENRTPVVEDTEAAHADTLKELPLVEDRPLAEDKPSETLVPDTCSTVSAPTSDSIEHAPVSIMDSEKPDSRSVTTEEKSEKEEVQKSEETQQDSPSSLME